MRSRSLLVFLASLAVVVLALRPVSALADNETIYKGIPRSAKPASRADEVLVNEGYIVGYSEARKDPLWVAYHLVRVENPETHPRPSRFRIDDRTEARVKHDCYTNSGFDRGHNAPNYAMDTRYGLPGQRASFLMSNICPQEADLNRQTWEAFEKVEATDYANSFGEIWTVTGPIFGSSPEEIPPCDVQVPVAFYKIVVREDEGQPAMLAIIMSQHQRGVGRLRKFTTTVDGIEEQTGLDFFPDLPDGVENRVETAGPNDRWHLDRLLVPTRFLPADDGE